ncbi:metallophosphoesterase [Chitinophaga sp. S165]|uniref:metallophosphoesterase family protein n=1 Tax=Chitinophaga sp. S165 TaxID=2135462 RepID=UPI000D711191|nr:metallophosphoesterase [Chitinophaga sp. S165]PWV56923.1 3',5'-cyclic AMP phosphodiesterase CpdA [Chitinophaga sp. S165]
MRYKTPVLKKDQPDDSYKFRALPKPSGAYPYHLSIRDVIPDINHDKMIFHMVGDTGSMRSPDFQEKVVGQMVRQYQNSSKHDQPQFLFHLGDVVYNHGEASQYQRQFFDPYKLYPGPVFAIAGNHDSDVNPDVAPYNSLDAFMTVFCDTAPHQVAFSGGSERKSMVQPNVYWTLTTPLANIIGMHSNVPKFGIVTDEQKEWLKEELRTADRERPGKAVILCIHHAPYSADVNHGASIPMITLLESVFAETGIRPDIVFSGHVHNYQRLKRNYPEGKPICFIVAGGGGYDELHAVASVEDNRFTNEDPLLKNVDLESYCDDKHGFLKVTLERRDKGLTLTGNYYAIPHPGTPGSDVTATLEDTFTIEI